MSLTGVLVDRARVVGRRDAGRKVAGRTIYSDVAGDWFKARLTLPSSGEQVDPATGVRPVTLTPLLLYGTRDLAGEPVNVTGDDRVELDSKELGFAVFDVIGDAEPLRKKRRVIGFQIPLRRVVVHEAEPV